MKTHDTMDDDESSSCKSDQSKEYQFLPQSQKGDEKMTYTEGSSPKKKVSPLLRQVGRKISK